MATKAQHITLSAQQPPLRVTGLRGQTAPIVSGGYGGWQTVARPRRKALTEWVGADPIELTFSAIFDGYAAGASVEGDCGRLERMALQPGSADPPPRVVVTGAVPHSGFTWVIEALSWAPDPIYSERGVRLRHEATLKLLEYVPADLAPTAAQAARSAGAAAATTRIYVVKRGDTLQSIAAAKLGSYKRWPEIARLNGIRDPRNIHLGERLKLP